MDVTCERCGTEYEFDETLVAARGTTVKCTNCGHLFKVFRPGASAAEPRSWAVRRDGSSASENIASLKELQRMITIGQLTPDDQISRSGEGWKRLGDIAELQTFFAAAQAARSERRDPTGRPSTREPSGRQTTREPTGPIGREPTGSRTADRRAYTPAPDSRSDRPPPSPSSRPGALPSTRTGKSTMLGLGSAGRSAPPTGDDIRGRTLEVAVPPPANGSYASSAGSVPAARADSTSTSPGMTPAPPGRPPAPPRAAPPSSRPPAPGNDGSSAPQPPIPPPPRTPRFPDTHRDLGEASAEARATATRRSSHSPLAPATRERPSVRPLHVDEDDDVPVRPRGRSRSGLWVSLVLLLAMGGGVAAGWDRITALIAGSTQTDPVEPFVRAGDGSLRLDHQDAYEDAIAHYTKALAFREHDPRALAGLSRAHALIAQQRIFEASDLEARAADDAGLRAQATAMRSQATTHVEQAREHAEEATRHGPGDGDVEIALSDALRLAGDPTLAASRLARGRTLLSEPSAEALRVEALLATNDGDMAAARPLAERAVAEDPGLLRARLLLARAQLAAGDVSGAQAQLQAVLDRVADHPVATALRTAIAEGLPPASPVVQADAGVGAIQPMPMPDTPAPTTPPATTPTSPTPTSPTPTSPATTSPSTTTPSTSEAAAGGGSRSYAALVREGDQRLENGDTRRARTLYEQALRERAGGAEAAAGLGFVMLAEGNARGALAQLQGAAQRGYADALIGVGDAHRRLGDRPQALAAYEQYLSRQPSGPRASIARRQADRLRAELGTGGATTPETGGTEGSTESPAEGGSTASPTEGTTEPPSTAPDELPAPSGTTEPPPQDVPAIDSEP